MKTTPIPRRLTTLQSSPDYRIDYSPRPSVIHQNPRSTYVRGVSLAIAIVTISGVCLFFWCRTLTTSVLQNFCQSFTTSFQISVVLRF